MNPLKPLTDLPRGTKIFATFGSDAIRVEPPRFFVVTHNFKAVICDRQNLGVVAPFCSEEVAGIACRQLNADESAVEKFSWMNAKPEGAE